MPEIGYFWVQNVKLGKNRPRHFNGLEKTQLEPKFEVSSSKDKNLAQLRILQKVWKILLSSFRRVEISSCRRVERSIFQTFWKIHSCAKFLSFELETSNFGSSYVFSSPLKWWGRFLPNLMFWTQKWHISGKMQVSHCAHSK